MTMIQWLWYNDYDKMTMIHDYDKMTMLQWLCYNDYVTMTLCYNDYVTMTMIQWYSDKVQLGGWSISSALHYHILFY